jgi:nitrite reductase/ring-hydroxylating ferredoxin subunit
MEPPSGIDGRELCWHALCPGEDLPGDGTGRAFEVAGRRLAVFLHDGRPYALDDECPHQGASLGGGVLSRGEVTCPWHSFHFDLCTGRNADGLALQVAVHPARLRDDGTVEVGLATSLPQES